MPVNLNPKLAVAAGLPADTDFADDSVLRGWVQRRALFEVPAGTPEELVQYAGDSYRRTFGNELERQGFRVMDMSKPVKVTNRPGRDPDRTTYGILARVTRRPVAIKMELPDLAAAEFERRGERIS